MIGNMQTLSLVLETTAELKVESSDEVGSL